MREPIPDDEDPPAPIPRKLTLDDVRLSAEPCHNVIAAPAWSFREYRRCVDRWDPIIGWWRKPITGLEPIPEVWADICVELRRRRDKIPERNIFGQRISKRDRCRMLDTKYMELRTCLVCGQEFFARGKGTHHTSLCTERCARIRRDQTRTRGNWHRKPVEHPPRPCDHCNHNFIPTRSDSRFCSVRCRVANHRAEKRAGLPPS
jgi:hypothetical protein